MKRYILLVCFLIPMVNNVLSQNNNEELYLEVLESILKEKIFDLKEVEFKYQKDTCIFYGRSDSFIEDTEKRYEFKYDTRIIKVWPTDHIFFYSIITFVRIIDFRISTNEAFINLEIFIDNKIVEKFNVILKKKCDSWKIEKDKQ